MSIRRTLWELIRKDFLVFVSDRKAMVITFLVPIAIATFLGSLLGNMSSGAGLEKVSVLIVDEDGSATTHAIVDQLKSSGTVTPIPANLAQAKKEVRAGEQGSAAVFPKGFGEAASAAMTAGAEKPTMTLLTDPSKGLEAQVAKGMLIQAVAQAVARQTFGAGPATTIPFSIKEQPQAAPGAANWSGSAHAFAGLGVQALFFGAVEAAMIMLRDRRNGIWSRLRAAPVSPWLVLFGKFIGSMLQSFFVYVVVFGVGSVIFGYRITGSVAGFTLIMLCTGAMAAGVGLFIAALGKSEQQSRGLSILVILVMLMLGGAWIPMFVLPKWVQTVSLFTPVSWAINGVDKMTWGGGTFAEALKPAAVLLGFALALSLIAGKRFRWEPEGR